MLFSHVAVGGNDIKKAKKFYDAPFKISGVDAIIDPKERLMYIKDNQLFAILKPIDGNPATVANGSTIGFKLASAEQVNQWYQAGIEHGGMAIENPPGIRDVGTKHLYLAYLRDPDGNKLCGFYSMN